MSHDRIDEPVHFLQFPEIVILKILEYFSYNEIANFRIVCQQFNDCCKILLNKGFKKAMLITKTFSKKLREEMPEKENEKIYNHLIYCDIAFGVEAKLIRLSNTFSPYIEENICCFIPGKVLDEIFYVVRYLHDPKNIFIKEGASMLEKYNILFKELRTPFIMKELNDLTTMAIEYFEENIAENLDLIKDNNFYVDSIDSSLKSSAADEASCYKGNNCKVSTLAISALRTKLKETCQKIDKQDKEFSSLSRIVSEQSSMLEHQKSKFMELNKVMVENEEKMKTFMNSINNKHVDSSTENFYKKKVKPRCGVSLDASTSTFLLKQTRTLRSSSQVSLLSHEPKNISARGCLESTKFTVKKGKGTSESSVRHDFENSDKNLKCFSSSKRKRYFESQSDKNRRKSKIS